MSWGAIILAGGLCPEALGVRLGTPRKGLARFGDRPSLEWVLDAVRAAGIGPCVTVAGEDLEPAITYGTRCEEGDNAIDNALRGANEIDTERLLILPADCPLLKGSCLQEFMSALEARMNQRVWFGAGLCPTPDFQSAFPGVDCTSLRLREGRYLSGALFATTREGLRQGQDLFLGIRRSRKNQIQMAARFGFGALAKYLVRQMSLPEAEARVGRVLGGQALVVPNCSPESVFDFDTPDDYESLVRVFDQRA